MKDLLGWFGAVIGWALMLISAVMMVDSLHGAGPSPAVDITLLAFGGLLALGSGLWLDRRNLRSFLKSRGRR